MSTIHYRMIQVRWEEELCYLQLYRPDHDNTINRELIRECRDVVNRCRGTVKILVIEGLPNIFSMGADLDEVTIEKNHDYSQENKIVEELYLLWLSFVNESFISIAHVRGKVNAGGVGFVSACDLVIADDCATFSLSELLFGLLPACVLPFIIRKIGRQKAQYMTLMTSAVKVDDAVRWGLVDASHIDSQRVLREHISRLRRIPMRGIKYYKEYMQQLDDSLSETMPMAVLTNHKVFSDKENIASIQKFQSLSRPQ